MKINVLVATVDGQKKVFLRSVNRDVFPWQFTVVEEAKAAAGAPEHQRNCDFESEAERYFRMFVDLRS